MTTCDLSDLSNFGQSDTFQRQGFYVIVVCPKQVMADSDDDSHLKAIQDIFRSLLNLDLLLSSPLDQNVVAAINK